MDGVRVCASDGCITILSRFNPAGRCHLHSETIVRTPRDPIDDEAWLAFMADIEPWEAPHMVQPPWAPRAACASSGHYLDDAFAEETSDGEPTEQVLAFKSMCLDCPVRSDCLTWALEHESKAEYREGIFGGLTPRERAEIAHDPDPVAAGVRELDEQHASGLVRQVYPLVPWHRQADSLAAQRL